MKYSEIISAVAKNPDAEIPFREIDELLETLCIDKNLVSRKVMKELDKSIRCFNLLGDYVYALYFNFNKVIFEFVALCEDYGNLQIVDSLIYRRLQAHILELVNKDADKFCMSQNKLNKNVSVYQKSNIDKWSFTFFLESHKEFFYKKGKKFLSIKNIEANSMPDGSVNYSITLKDCESRLVVFAKDIYVKYNIGD